MLGVPQNGSKHELTAAILQRGTRINHWAIHIFRPSLATHQKCFFLIDTVFLNFIHNLQKQFSHLKYCTSLRNAHGELWNEVVTKKRSLFDKRLIISIQRVVSIIITRASMSSFTFTSERIKIANCGTSWMSRATNGSEK